ncbi:MAG: helix-turn-helix domain-containing protein [Beijerinckiaceae bacterium]|nr:helix-turn-helix domain-containing protein [Beijerinckiaceae bacterium]
MAYSPAEAAKTIGIGRTKLYALISEGHFSPRRIGRRRIILASDLETYLARLPVSDAARRS